MRPICLDHNGASDVSRLLTAAGYDVVTAQSLGLDAAEDDHLLPRSAEEGRVLVTHNARDFELLHSAWRHWSARWGIVDQHAGVVIMPRSLVWR